MLKPARFSVYKDKSTQIKPVSLNANGLPAASPLSIIGNGFTSSVPTKDFQLTRTGSIIRSLLRGIEDCAPIRVVVIAATCEAK